MSALCLKRNPTEVLPMIGSVHIYPLKRARARFCWPALTKGRKFRNSWLVALIRHLTRIAVYFDGNSQKCPECSGRGCRHRIATKNVGG
jgi:hypothetical protein